MICFQNSHPRKLDVSLGSSQVSSNTDHVFLLFAINGMGFDLRKIWILGMAQEGFSIING